jgi:hypothetical protein
MVCQYLKVNLIIPKDLEVCLFGFQLSTPKLLKVLEIGVGSSTLY